MKTDRVEWESFWDLGSPNDAACAFVELYQSKAIEAAEECVRTAAADNREEDCRFWKAVIITLCSSQTSILFQLVHVTTHEKDFKTTETSLARAHLSGCFVVHQGVTVRIKPCCVDTSPVYGWMISSCT